MSCNLPVFWLLFRRWGRHCVCFAAVEAYYCLPSLAVVVPHTFKANFHEFSYFTEATLPFCRFLTPSVISFLDWKGSVPLTLLFYTVVVRVLIVLWLFCTPANQSFSFLQYSVKLDIVLKLGLACIRDLRLFRCIIASAPVLAPLLFHSPWPILALGPAVIPRSFSKDLPPLTISLQP